jgi:ABC-2 type transport system ATP-binding protein
MAIGLNRTTSDPSGSESEGGVAERTEEVGVGAAALSARGVRKVYKSSRKKRGKKDGQEGGGGDVNVALDGLDLEVEPGRWVALLGPNGSGKSTFMRLAATLERPDEGNVEILGFDSTQDAASVRERLGMVFQNPALDGLLTVRENLVTAAALVGVKGEERRRRIETLLEEVGLSDRAGERVDRLSGGLARRADLARALIGMPRMLLLDEPTTGLDLEARRAFLDAIKRRVGHDGAAAQPSADGEAQAGGLTVLMSTHMMSEAERADIVVMMSHGKVVARGTARELREAMGERVVHADEGNEGVLREAGLEVSVVDGACVGRGGEDAVERAVVELTRKGAAFRVGPPTLGDVYLARTGERLG